MEHDYREFGDRMVHAEATPDGWVEAAPRADDRIEAIQPLVRALLAVVWVIPTILLTGSPPRFS
jgi:hypothetical protein